MTNWPHAPIHQLTESGAYIVTCGTYLKLHHFRKPQRLQFLHDLVLDLAPEFCWQLEAWAVFSNHYHFVGQNLDDPASLRLFLTKLHKETATWVNQHDGTLAKVYQK